MDSMNGQHGKQASRAVRRDSQAGMLSVLLSILASKRVVLDRQQGRNRLDPRVENHLVLSATTKDCDLAQIVQRFSLLPIQSYIFTKIDETEEYTSLFNQLLRYKRPLSYLTNGQRVPEDIELATKGRVASLVLDRIPWN